MVPTQTVPNKFESCKGGTRKKKTPEEQAEISWFTFREEDFSEPKINFESPDIPMSQIYSIGFWCGKLVFFKFMLNYGWSWANHTLFTLHGCCEAKTQVGIPWRKGKICKNEIFLNLS